MNVSTFFKSSKSSSATAPMILKALPASSSSCRLSNRIFKPKPLQSCAVLACTCQRGLAKEHGHGRSTYKVFSLKTPVSDWEILSENRFYSPNSETYQEHVMTTGYFVQPTRSQLNLGGQPVPCSRTPRFNKAFVTSKQQY